MAIVRILAFDPGTANMGYSTLNGDTKSNVVALGGAYFGVLKTSKWKEGSEVPIRERLDNLGLGARQLIHTVEPTHIVIEDFVEQGRRVGKTYKEMAFLIEHMRLLGRDFGIEVDIYANGYWKKQTMNAPHASKVQVQHFVAHRLPEAKQILKGQPDHVWDSVGIGYCKWLELVY